ncbi:delta-sarcoglycan-like isoform X2 [Centruroides sculpturatus]|uniref:delta-sarcoglycan-like isoform X2 n=1 Tax=Centruroides sculpturatus TaxID=218467 RepID=UPI000C6E49F6|nr:delta-sarcoglycan-like isoform X2 [Centruroides sculpturatus]
MIMGTGAASTATTPASQDWIGTAPPGATEGTNLHYVLYSGQCVHKIGIYGWRKRCLYLLVVLLMAMVIINVALTIWIVRVMDFSTDGMGRLKILQKGIKLDGETHFLQSLYATEIRSRKEQPLKIESYRNITLNARNKDGIITNRLFVGESLVDAIAEKFIVKNRNGQILFSADDSDVSIATQRLRITGVGGVRFEGSIQTPLVRAEPYEQLRLESPTRKLKVQAPHGVEIQSRAGDVIASCLKDMKLESKQGAIWLDSDKIEMKNLKTALPTTRGRSYPGIYQLCVCENGRMFLSPSQGFCQADDLVCKNRK